MALTIRTVLLLVAIICFFLAAVGVAASRLNVTALGLFFLSAALLFP